VVSAWAKLKPSANAAVAANLHSGLNIRPPGDNVWMTATDGATAMPLFSYQEVFEISFNINNLRKTSAFLKVARG
jgi:hypothetical protein